MVTNVPEGLGPGDAPGGAAWSKSLWIVLPASPTASQVESLGRLRVEVKEHEDVSVTEIRLQNARGVGGRMYPLVPAKDLAGLYRHAHRYRTGIIALGEAKVLLDISELPSNRG